MTDLYEALRAAMTPDGRVRLTRELLTAMHEEGERRSRMDDTAQPDPLTEMRDRFLTAMCRMREAESRAETAERELEGAEREADEQRERRKRAEVERDAAHERARVAERERDEIDAHKCQLSLMLRDAQRALGARKRVRIIAREPLDPAPQSPPIEIILTSGPAGILFHVADAGSVGVLEDFLRYLGHEIVVDKPATIASSIANTGLDELGHDVERDEGDT